MVLNNCQPRLLHGAPKYVKALNDHKNIVLFGTFLLITCNLLLSEELVIILKGLIHHFRR